mgnify:CR=1 FL=1
MLHESQRPGMRIEQVLRPASWAEAIELYASLPEALPTAGATDLLLEMARQPATAEAEAVTLIDLWGLHSVLKSQARLTMYWLVAG